MKCFGPEFRVGRTNSFPYPADPHGFVSLKHMVTCYEEFAQMCDNWGQKPAPQWVYFGDVLEVENANGVWLYPDYPDRILDVGPRGGIQIQGC